LRVLRYVLHTVQIFAIVGLLVWDETVFFWGLALSTLAIFTQILLDRGEKVATPLEILRDFEEAEQLRVLERK
jgi:hypothetical protein